MKVNAMANFIKSLKRNYLGIILMIISASSLALGQLLWKISAGKDYGLLAGGFIIYGFGAVSMIIAYRYGRLSVLHPMMSLSYILAFLLGFSFLGEDLNVGKIAGLIVIIIGCILIGGGDDI